MGEATIVAIVGYGLAALFLLTAVKSEDDYRRAKLLGDRARAEFERKALIGSVALCLAVAALTRWLTGGPF